MKRLLIIALVIGASVVIAEDDEEKDESTFCDGEVPAADIVVMLDSSWTVKKKRWHYMTDLFDYIAENVNYGPHGTHMGAIRFSNWATEVISLGEYDTVEEVTEAMDKVPFKKGHGNTHRALRRLVEHTLSKENSRSGVPRIGVLVTDDKTPNPALTKKAVKKIREDGIKLVVVAIKHNKWYRYSEMLNIAGSKSALVVAKGFKVLETDRKREQIMDAICYVAKEAMGASGSGSGEETSTAAAANTDEKGPEEESEATTAGPVAVALTSANETGSGGGTESGGGNESGGGKPAKSFVSTWYFYVVIVAVVICLILILVCCLLACARRNKKDEKKPLLEGDKELVK